MPTNPDLTQPFLEPERTRAPNHQSGGYHQAPQPPVSSISSGYQRHFIFDTPTPNSPTGYDSSLHNMEIHLEHPRLFFAWRLLFQSCSSACMLMLFYVTDTTMMRGSCSYLFFALMTALGEPISSLWTTHKINQNSHRFTQSPACFFPCSSFFYWFSLHSAAASALTGFSLMMTTAFIGSRWEAGQTFLTWATKVCHNEGDDGSLHLVEALVAALFWGANAFVTNYVVLCGRYRKLVVAEEKVVTDVDKLEEAYRGPQSP
jgi:hypothetical protein